MHDFTNLHTIQQLLSDGATNCPALTTHYLAHIDEGAELNAFISVFKERALAQAEAIERKRAQGTAGALAGMVLAIKDNIVLDYGGTTCGSEILRDFKAPYTATVLQRLADADAIFIGKTNMDEFAMGSSTENSAFGAVRNPVNRERVPGGSSGGSAAAVAAGMCTAALGSDTGGSIRQPASFCGVIGLKPSYGRVSRYGLVAFASSLDQIGPLTRSTADAAALLQVMAGHDPLDATSASLPVPDFSATLEGGIAGMRIGIPKEYYEEGLEEPVRQALSDTVRFFEELQAVTVPVSLPHTPYSIAAYYILANAEASANLARYDGAHYGVRAGQSPSLEEMYVNTRSRALGAEVKRRIMLGTYVLSSGYYEAYYNKAQQVRTCIRADFEKAWRQCDVLLTPTCPTTAFRIGEKVADPLTMYLSDVYTVSVNLSGLPALSIPCGRDTQGLPIGAQLIGRPFDEGTLLRLAHLMERHFIPARQVLTNGMG